MTPLEQEIAWMIRESGPISLEKYMELALSHARHGYYMTRDPIGVHGDFTTAPEISQMFGELLGLWAAGAWEAMGSPGNIRLVELGPGRGTLMLDALRASRVAQEFFASLHVDMVETSPVLTRKQRDTLARSGLPIHWHQSLDTVPAGPAIVFANEFFDALPVRQYVRTPDGWCEKGVGLDAQGALALGILPVPEPSIRTSAPDGATLEIGAAGYRQMNRLAQRLQRQGGVALVIDYGYRQTGLGGTFQAVRKHKPVDPLAEPGLADLTAHVDFSALARAAQAAGAQVQGPVGQGAFLAQLGIFERAAALEKRANAAQSTAIRAGLMRLTAAGEGMGELFKVLAVKQAGLPVLSGFAAGGVFDG